jgi:hypothetical protein
MFMKRILFSALCLILLSQGLAAQAAVPASAAPAGDCQSAPLPFLTASLPAAPAVEAVPDLPFLTPAPSAASCPLYVCRSQCSCPGCFSYCVSTATCECDCICN